MLMFLATTLLAAASSTAAPSSADTFTSRVYRAKLVEAGPTGPAYQKQFWAKTGNPMTDAARLTERFRRPTFGTLEIDVTVDDPKAYTKPWTVRVNQRILPDSELIEFICLENQQFESYLNRQK